MPLLVYVSYERRGMVTVHFCQESRYPDRKRSRHMVVCQLPRETQDTQCVIYRKRKVPDFNPLYLENYSIDFYQIYIVYALHIHDLTYQI